VSGRLEFLRSAYLSIDRRVLGVFRITYGLVLLFELIRRGIHLELLYSNDGILSNHFLLFRPRVVPQFSLFTAFSTPEEVRFAFILTGVVFLAFTLGLYTRLAQLLSLVLFASLNQRQLLHEDGGVSVLILSNVWTLFMPLGDRYSLDAVRRDALRATVKERVIQRRAARQPFFSLAVLAVLLNIATIYALNAAHKNGSTWKHGEAVHYVLWQTRCSTPLADFIAHHDPRWFSPFTSYGTIVLEGLMPFLVLVPFRRDRLRTAAFVLAVLFHLGIASIMTLGPFSYAMIALLTLVIPGSTLEAVGRRIPRRYFWAAARQRARACRFVSRLRKEPRPIPALTPAREALARARFHAREVCVGLVMIASIIQVTRDNRFFAKGYRLTQPAPFETLIRYTRMLQGWQMFAPEAPRDEGLVVIDAITADGRHIDPFTGKEPDFESVLRGPLALPVPVSDYLYAMHSENEEVYRGELEKYLQRWHEIKHRPPGDRIVSFDAWFVKHDTPVPGSTACTNYQKQLVFSGRF